MSPIEKPCIFCKESCVGLPRIKDPEGRYAHKACAERAQTSQAQSAQAPPPVASLDLSHDDEPEMAAFLDDLPGPDDAGPVESSGLRMACPGCGSSISSESTVCMSCGCNVKTGKGIKTKVVKSKSPKNGPGIGSIAGSMGTSTLLPIIGACIGGAIGAAIWAAVAYFTNFEIGILATGIGVICGFGALFGGHGGNAYSGMVAVVVAILAILVGKMVVFQIYMNPIANFQAAVEAELADPTTVDTIEIDTIYQYIVDELAQERFDNGVPIVWPTSWMTIEDAVWPDDYPQDLIDETIAFWDGMSAEEQLSYKESTVQDINEYVAEANAYLEEELAEASQMTIVDTLGPFDILWGILALAAAWQVGSGGNE